MAQLLNRDGLTPVMRPEDAAFIIVNTCGFLHSAREEAIAVMTDLASEKLPWQKIIAAGCMTERHRQDILKFVPGIDGMLGTRRWMDILDVISNLKQNHDPYPYQHFPQAATIGKDEKGTLRAAIQGGSAYLKIADGCRRACSYCLIPLIKGPLVSRSIDSILDDARALQDGGVKEIILIAQDTTDYGRDLGLKDGLTALLEALLKAVPALPWIRLMYAYPGMLSNSLIDLMADSPQILPYLDLPLQHADPVILKAMHRPWHMQEVRDTIHKMRTRMPSLALRTTFIVGFPGEDERAFKQLTDFTQNVQFDHVGVFPYSFEVGAPAEPLGDPVSEQVKTQRVEQLMIMQAEISLARNQQFIGKTLPVLVEGIDADNHIAIGRSYRDAPEIDGLVIIEGSAPVGEIVDVTIHSAITHDLLGTLTSESDGRQ